MTPDGKGAKAGDKFAGEKGGKGAGKARSLFYDPWVRVDYLHTWLEGRHAPPLLTTSPPGSEGVLDPSDPARILFGNDEIGGDLQAAGRLDFGVWLDPCQEIGVGGEFFGIEGEKVGFDAGPQVTPLLARPFFDTGDFLPLPFGDGFPDNAPASLIVAGQIANVQATGEFHARTETDVLGAEAYVRRVLIKNQRGRLDFIGGYHFSRVDDSLHIDTITRLDPPIAAAQLDLHDAFDARNKFHGGTLGLLGEVCRGPLMLSLLTKASLGNMRQEVDISGSFEITDAGGGVDAGEGGLLALPTNIANYRHDEFAVIPEAQLKVTWSLTEHLDFSLGYTVIYWSSVALAADQIVLRDGMPVVNSDQLFGQTLPPNPPPVPPDPTLTHIHDESLWLHGLSLGFTFRM